MIYSRCHSPVGIIDALCNKFWTLRIGQKCRAVCKNLVVMEMHCQQECKALAPHAQEACLAGH